MGSDIFVIAEQRGGQVRRPTLEALGVAKRLAQAEGGKTVAVVLGKDATAAADVLGRYGADKVLVSEDENLHAYSTGGYAHVVAELVKRDQPAAVLMAASSMARDLAPRIAARLDVGLLPDCVDVQADADKKIVAKRYIYSGKALATVKAKGITPIVTTRPKVFELPAENAAAKAEVVAAGVGVEPSQCFGKVKEIVTEAVTKIELTEADVVVAGGRGMQGPEQFGILEELAGVLNAAVGASRAAVDAGWREHAAQVGQTGKVVQPKLYIACGISGAIQHLVGMGNSKVIVAINKDADAPLLKLADYSVVGDLFQIVPAVTKELKRVLEK